MQELDKSGRLSSEMFDEVDWTALGDGLRSTSEQFQMWASKHIAGQCGVGKWQERWQFWDHSRCPCCGQDGEDVHHILRCPDPRMRTCFTEQLTTFRTKLEDLETDPDIIESLMAGITSETSSFRTPDQDSCLDASTTQDGIGWQATLEGLLCSQWRSIQAQYYSTMESRRRSHTWAASVSLALLCITHRMWNTRNKILHPKGEHRGTIFEISALDDLREELLETDPELLLLPDRHLLTGRTRAQLYRLTGNALQMWISNVQDAIAAAAAHRASGRQSQDEIMQSWLHGT